MHMHMHIDEVWQHDLRLLDIHWEQEGISHCSGVANGLGQGRRISIGLGHVRVKLAGWTEEEGLCFSESIT